MHDDRRADREDVAPPISHVEDEQSHDDARSQHCEPEPRRDRRGEEGEGNGGQNHDGRVDGGVADGHRVPARLGIHRCAVEKGPGRLPERPSKVEADRPCAEIAEYDAADRERERQDEQHERIAGTAECDTEAGRRHLAIADDRHTPPLLTATPEDVSAGAPEP